MYFVLYFYIQVVTLFANNMEDISSLRNQNWVDVYNFWLIKYLRLVNNLQNN